MGSGISCVQAWIRVCANFSQKPIYDPYSSKMDVTSVIHSYLACAKNSLNFEDKKIIFEKKERLLLNTWFSVVIHPLSFPYWTAADLDYDLEQEKRLRESQS